MQQNTLNHLAIIMDGNGRWAKNRTLPRTDGHKMGAKVIRKITQWCAKNHIDFLTLYAFSTENWQRPKSEVSFLMKLLEKYLRDEEKTYIENNIKFKAIGDISAFSPKLRDLIAHLEAKTAQNTALTQILALNYGAKDEIARAIKKMMDFENFCHSERSVSEAKNLKNENRDFSPTAQNDKAKEAKLTKEQILQIFESALDTANIPPVDLLVRTGGEMRLSNFLLYQCAYAELYFSKTLFPDFETDELSEIVDDFRVRNRRFGEVK
ncbi:polyprenyl diphosphate synthase [Helicobacter sp. 23-1045]